jgi:hypothetical protein
VPLTQGIVRSALAALHTELLDPAGRDRRRRAVESLQHGAAAGLCEAPAPTIKGAYRRGWVLGAVTEVLKAAGRPMRARAIHAAAEKLVGEPVSRSSVKNCLSAGVRSGSPRFERVGHGLYRYAA